MMRKESKLALFIVVLIPQISQAQVRIMSSHKQRLFMKALPLRIDSHEVIRIIRDPDSIWYTKQEMPSIHQNWDTSQSGGIVYSDYNIAAGLDRFGNANKEFPWLNPGGTDFDDRIVSVTVLNLPKTDLMKESLDPILKTEKVKESTTSLAIVMYKRRNDPMIHWIFPVGTYFMEVLYLRDEEGDLHCFEIRTRTREPDDWGVDILKPFPTRQKLVATLIKNDKVLQAVEITKAKVERVTLRSDHGRPFVVTATREILPRMNPSFVANLLKTTTFESSLAEDWSDQAQGVTAENQTINIVPSQYTGAHLGNDRIGCANCHKDVAKHARSITSNREWYGNVRGSDGIFSWHPFDPNSASNNGKRQNPVYRKAFTDNGIFERYDPKKHTAKYYQLSKYSG